MTDGDSKVNGWKGKLLRINLASGNASVENLSEDMLAGFIGGRGLGSKILADEVDPQVNPLDAANKIIFAAGPLVGTIAPGASRTHVVSKSPLTGKASCSNLGGHFGVALRSAGYDAIVLEGKAEEPVYVRIDGDLVELRDAKELWGQPVGATQLAISEVTGKETRQAALPSRTRRPTSRAVAGERAEVLCIGPAGERLDRIASIVGSEHWGPGGAGLGAGLGSKRVKAIAVSGSVPAQVAHAAEFAGAVQMTMCRLKENYVYYRRLAAYGTASFVRIAQDRGVLPTLNFNSGRFDKAASLFGEAVADSILKKTTACFGCPCACGRLTEVNGSKGTGPEYEHLVGFGSKCGISDLPAIAGAAYACRDEGFDAGSVAAGIGQGLGIAEMGALRDKDLDQGFRFGNGEALGKLIEQMVDGRGVGMLLRQGPAEVAKHLGRSEDFVGIGGQALGTYDPRGDEVMGLYCATSGTEATPLPGNLLVVAAPSTNPVDEAIRLQDFIAAIDSAGLCPLIAATLQLADVAAMLSAATGTAYSEAALRSACAAIWRTEKAFAQRAGVEDGKDMPERLLRPLGEEGAAVPGLRTSDLLPAYYRARNWEA